MHRKTARRKEYTKRGISRVPCYRCGAPSCFQWVDTACYGIGAPHYGLNLPVCAACDLMLNKMIAAFWQHEGSDELIAAYEAKLNVT